MAAPQKKLNDKGIVQLFIDHLATRGNPGLQVDRWPDEEKRQTPDIDAVAGEYAIEHTSFDTVPDQRRDAAWFVAAVGSLENELRGKLPFRLLITIPYGGIQSGQDWLKIKELLREWILTQAAKLSEGSRAVIGLPGVPFEIRVNRRPAGRPGLLLFRTAPQDDLFSERIIDQLDRKAKKLAPYKKQGKTTILLVESDDIALMNEDIMIEGIGAAYPSGLPRGVDQIWFADTAIPQEILFSEMTNYISTSAR